jgi:hypothetical protein
LPKIAVAPNATAEARQMSVPMGMRGIVPARSARNDPDFYRLFGSIA